MPEIDQYEAKRIEIVLNVYKIKFLENVLREMEQHEKNPAPGEYFRLTSELKKYEWQMYRYIINNKQQFDGDQLASVEDLIIERRWDVLLQTLFFIGFKQIIISDHNDPTQIDLAIHLPKYVDDVE